MRHHQGRSPGHQGRRETHQGRPRGRRSRRTGVGTRGAEATPSNTHPPRQQQDGGVQDQGPSPEGPQLGGPGVILMQVPQALGLSQETPSSKGHEWQRPSKGPSLEETPSGHNRDLTGLVIPRMLRCYHRITSLQGSPRSRGPIWSTKGLLIAEANRHPSVELAELLIPWMSSRNTFRCLLAPPFPRPLPPFPRPAIVVRNKAFVLSLIY